MYHSKKILAFIGAREGSKGLKNKNILNLAEKPLIVWTIEAAVGTQWIDRVLVSTDSVKIADVAKKAGAYVPFLRPKYLATDKSSQSDAIIHALDFLEKAGECFDFVMLLQPTSPLRTSGDINQAIQYYFLKDKTSRSSLVSVYRAPSKVGWLLYESPKGQVKFCFDVSKNLNRQMLNTFFLPNGAIYLAPVKIFRKEGFYSRRTLFFEMTSEQSIDIDTVEDFHQANAFLNKRIGKI